MKTEQILNKGNYSMDTQEREDLFYKRLSLGWEDEYHKYREKWNNGFLNHLVYEYPLNIDFELSSRCNLKCPMCYTVTDEFKKNVPIGFMDIEIFKKVIDEISGKVPAIRLSLDGESTLHPEFLECVRYAKSAGIREIGLLTNGSTMTSEFFESLMNAGIDLIIISIDGIGSVYESIRKPVKFEDIFNKIKEMKAIKDKYGVHKPLIKIQTIWPAIRNNPTEYYDKFVRYVDLIAFNPLIPYEKEEKKIEYVEEFTCPQIYQRLIITSNGDIIPCCTIGGRRNVISNIKNKTVYEIWHSETLNNLRNIFKNDNMYQKTALCKKCFLARKTEANESGIVHNRKFLIRNYV